jgi:hypothetical protein
MKKLIALIIIGTLLLGIGACGPKKTDDSKDKAKTESPLKGEQNDIDKAMTE